MIACFDAGNSRLKWGLADKEGWQAQGALEWSHLETLRDIVLDWLLLDQIFLVSVTRPEVEMALAAALSTLLPGVPLARILSCASACGVTNGYRDVEQLGADRWCALLGARALESRPCLVVNAGTATTIDSLDAQGYFMGGMILPGVNMMKSVLSYGTAQLPRVDAHLHAEFPQETRTAIATGCLEAQAGAIERAFARLPDAACCVLSGGAAPLIEPFLRIPVRSTPYLVLEGLRRLALETP
ncbi:MAG: type III pantothenate kinase [Zoogloeaceae bacterium]|jgi:type III pantothenate kinase|nr:type III pantothenate kinase [Zoogloeaceae bacterium]